MPVINVDKDNYKKVLQSNPIVVVDFWAPWCNPCNIFKPIFEEASKNFSDIPFLKVDIEANPELAKEESILSIPMIKIIKNGEEIFRKAGAMTLIDFVDLIRKEIA